MKNAITTLLAALPLAPVAVAAEGAPAQGSGLLTILFLAFGAAILVFQFVPAVTLFGSMVYGLFAASHRRISGTAGGKTQRNA